MTRTAEDPEPEVATGAADGGALARLLPVRTGLVIAAVFVAGLLVGALTVGLFGGDPVVVRTAEAAGGGAAAGPGLPSGDAAAQFVVNGACLGAVNAAQDTALLVDDVARGAAELDAAALDETVRRLMPLQTRLEAGLQECQVAVEVSGGGTGGDASASSSAVPSSGAPASGSPAGPSGD